MKGSYSSPGQKAAQKRSTTHASKPNRITASDKYKAGVGFR